MRPASASVLVLLGALLLAPVSLAESECSHKVVERATPGGEGKPGLVVDCGPPDAGGLLAPDAADTVCVGAADPSLPAGAVAECQQALANAQKLLRRARIRAALRQGIPDAAIQQTFEATPEELEGLRASAAATLPLSEVP